MRSIAQLKTLLIALAQVVALLAFAARADDIEVREARLTPTEDGIVLDAEFALELSPRLQAVANGVPLYFVVSSVTRPRWWWLTTRRCGACNAFRTALSRRYRLSTGAQRASLLLKKRSCAAPRARRRSVGPLPCFRTRLRGGGAHARDIRAQKFS
jgi:hypothetical protein